MKRRKTYSLEFELGVPLLGENNFAFEPLETNPEPEVDFSEISVPFHLSREILSYFPKARCSESLALDLGCGNGIHKGICEHAGFEWVGIDYNSEDAPILADGHALPFKDNSFDFLLSITVLEHIQFPFVMMHEAYRVLKPQGKFIGVVAFLEPFHGDSFYHHTHLGVYNSLHNGGFNVDKIAPNERWPVLTAQANMALFPRMPKPLPNLIVFPIQMLHKLWWKSAAIFTRNRRDVSESRRIRNTAGSFTFIAKK
ncbi:MAG: class I SAM-dependent methyltransferase [Anaerolineae bacterium]|nr:class I SAM-dependent methyltransferase [Anaerolineae bacterium]